jgi:hypothetical protein
MRRANPPPILVGRNKARRDALGIGFDWFGGDAFVEKPIDPVNVNLAG